MRRRLLLNAKPVARLTTKTGFPRSLRANSRRIARRASVRFIVSFLSKKRSSVAHARACRALHLCTCARERDTEKKRQEGKENTQENVPVFL